MPVHQRDQAKVWRLRSRGEQLALWAGWFVGTALFVYCWQLISEKTIWIFVEDAPRQAADLAARMVPPKWSYMESLWRPIWDTLNIATLGTAIALTIAVPVAFCAARNTTPSAYLVRPVALFIIVSSRSINSLIWALMLVAIIGPGVLAGVVAIGLRSIGFYGIVPQIMPAFAGISVFRWDINIRESTVLGLVGAGGIGIQLDASISNLAWTQVSLILLAILATVVVSEWVSAKVRHAII
jgi:phosphonate transport system permease protein